MEEKTHFSVTEVSDLLIKEGILKGKYPDQAVRRLIDLGEIEAVKPPVNQPKKGYQIVKTSLDEYIEIGKMNVSELRKELLKARRELEALKGVEPSVSKKK
jgi:hypothetical protein